VKYMRQLSRSESPEAGKILKAARECLVLAVDDNEETVTSAWSKTWALDARCCSLPRKAHSHRPQPATDVLKIPGVDLPELCPRCDTHFTELLNNDDDEILEIPGLLATAVSSLAVSLAASIRRAAIRATSADCCDTCACRVGS